MIKVDGKLFITLRGISCSNYKHVLVNDSCFRCYLFRVGTDTENEERLCFVYRPHQLSERCLQRFINAFGASNHPVVVIESQT